MSNEEDFELPNNGVAIYLDVESSEWVVSANRFSKVTVTDNLLQEMLDAAKKEFNDPEWVILEHLPKVGDVMGKHECGMLRTYLFEDAIKAASNTWEWLTRMTDDLPNSWQTND